MREMTPTFIFVSRPPSAKLAQREKLAIVPCVISQMQFALSRLTTTTYKCDGGQAMIKKRVTVNASRRAIYFLAIVLGTLVPLAAQESSSSRPIKLRLVIPEPNVCQAEKKLPLEVVFSNTGESQISVYKSAIYDFYFTKTIVRGKQAKVEDHDIRKDVGTGDPARHEPPMVLPPNASVVVPLEYEISDSFFHDQGTYSVRIRYMKLKTSVTPDEAVIGDLTSNEVFFLVTECH